jgi:hypothetical protein
LHEELAAVKAGIDDAMVLAHQLFPGILGNLAEFIVHVDNPARPIRDGHNGAFIERVPHEA